MNALSFAEKRSKVDEAFLKELSVYYKTKPTDTSSELDNRDTASPKGRSDTTRQPQPLPQTKALPSDPRPKENPAPNHPPLPVEPGKGDRSEEILQTLTETQRKLFEALPLDHAVTVDYLMRSGFLMKDIMSAMTVLEIKGLTVMLPGGLFSRK